MKNEVKKSSKKDIPFADWKRKSWKEILQALRKEDNKKSTDTYLKELVEWEK